MQPDGRLWSGRRGWSQGRSHLERLIICNPCLLRLQEDLGTQDCPQNGKWAAGGRFQWPGRLAWTTRQLGIFKMTTKLSRAGHDRGRVEPSRANSTIPDTPPYGTSGAILKCRSSTQLLRSGINSPAALVYGDRSTSDHTSDQRPVTSK